MSSARKILSLLISGVVWINGASCAQAVNAKPKARQEPMVHMVIINMSGKSREARVRDMAVPLPVAQRVLLEVPRGGSITIASETDSRVARVITATSGDDGRVITVD